MNTCLQVPKVLILLKHLSKMATFFFSISFLCKDFTEKYGECGSKQFHWPSIQSPEGSPTVYFHFLLAKLYNSIFYLNSQSY